MMNPHRPYIETLGILAGYMMLMLASACSPHDNAVVPEPENPDSGAGWLSLSLHMPASMSRAESHPDEPAVNHESDVENLTVFIYASGIYGLNDANTTPFHATRYITKSEFTSDQTIGNERVITIKFQPDNYNLKLGDRIAVVANMGDLSAFTALGQLQRYRPGATWKAGTRIADYTDFTMASASNEYPDGYVVSPQGTGEPGSEANPLISTISIERTAARIDLDHKGGVWAEDNGEHFLVYPAIDKTGKTVGHVYLSHMLPFNVMRQPSYALKRISATATPDMSCFDSWTYTGTLPKDGQKPTAYVIEPQTGDKASPSETDCIAWYGDTRAGLIADLGKEYFADKPRLDINPAAEYTILSYANENTAHVNHTTADNLTGTIIRAQYVPALLHTNIHLTDPETAVARGTDLWRYTPQNTSTDETDVIYFNTEEVAEAYRAAHPGDMASITKFDRGECYYHLWLKHTAVTDDVAATQPTFPMEYGIVRNHIYRVALTFRGIGRQGTEVDNPHNIEMTIFVRPWRFFTHDTIIM